jgi:ubiquitin C-terminal hydrolase
MNSVLQIFAQIYELNIVFNDESKMRKLLNTYDSHLLVEWDKLRRQMNSSNHPINPTSFLQALHQVSLHKKNGQFQGFNQNDVSEFILFVVDCFHEALSRKVNMQIEGNVRSKADSISRQCFETMKQLYENQYSEIIDIFYGMQISELQMESNIRIIPESFFILHLPIPLRENPTLNDCLNLYLEKEMLDGENGIYDESVNKKMSAIKRIQIWNFPKVFVIVLKRFLPSYKGQHKKNQIFVDFPVDEWTISTQSYQLFGVCNHSGSTLGGHYTCFVKNETQNWFHCNDTIVEPINDLSSIVTPKAYCLFYRKIGKNNI